MAHKIRIGHYSQKNQSDWATISLILGCILLFSGPGYFRAGLIMNLASGSYIILSFLGFLATCIGLILLLHSKLLKRHNKLLASAFCFYASLNSIFLIDSIDKLKEAAQNIEEAAAEAGIAFSTHITEENVAIMDMINSAFIVVFMIIGIVLLVIYLYQCHLDSERMPPEPPGPPAYSQ